MNQSFACSSFFEACTLAMAPKAKAKAKTKAKNSKAMKLNPLRKGKPLRKGNTPCSKDSKTIRVRKSALKKNNLAKLGKMTLAEKVAKAGEEADTPEEAAQSLKGMLDKQEKTRVWSKFNTHLKHLSEEEQEAHKKKSKLEKGLEAAVHMVKVEVPKFFHYQESVQHSQTLDKREKWKSEKKMREDFGDDEFLQHLESGRIEWRDDPFTYGVYNYRDRGDITKTTSVKRKKEWAQGQEYEVGEDDEKEWQALKGKDLQSHLQEAQCWKGKSLGKGQLALGKGKGKGTGKKGKGKTQLALEDGKMEDEEEEEEETEEEQWKVLLSKAKKARDQANSAKEDCEAAVQKADLAKRLTKQAKKENEAMLEEMAKKVVALKELLAKKEKAMSLEKGKSLVLQVMQKVKETKEESKELNQLANKAGSKASKR